MYFKSVVFCQNKAHSFEFNFVLYIIVHFGGAVPSFEVAPCGWFLFPTLFPTLGMCGRFSRRGLVFLGVCVINVVYILHFVMFDNIGCVGSDVCLYSGLLLFCGDENGVFL